MVSQFFLILLYGIYTFNEFPNSELFNSILGTFTVAVIGLLIGITGGGMTVSSWLGDVLFTNQVKKEMIKNNISLLHYNRDGDFEIINPKAIRITSDQNENVWVVDSAKNPLRHYAPVIVTTNEENITKIRCGIDGFESIYFNCNASWREYLLKHYDSLKSGVERVSWVLMLIKTVPYSPLNIGRRNDLQHNLSYNIKIKTHSNKTELVNLKWNPPKTNFKSQYPDFHKNNSALHTVTKSGSRGILGTEYNIISDLTNGEESDSAALFLRSFSHLMIALRSEYVNNIGSKSEISRLTINSMAEWFSLVVKSKKEIFPPLPSGADIKNSENVISLDIWGHIIKNTISQPSTVFLRIHDRAVQFIEDDSYAEMLKHLFNDVITESIEHALQTSSVELTGNSVEMDIGRRSHTNNRVAAMLIGVCRMLLLISLYDDPERGVIR